MDGKCGLSDNFSVIFPFFVPLLVTKLMAKWSRAPNSYQEVTGFSTGLNFDFFFLRIFKIPQIFRHFYFF